MDVIKKNIIILTTSIIMSLNFNRMGTPIARIKGDGKKKILYLDEKNPQEFLAPPQIKKSEAKENKTCVYCSREFSRMDVMKRHLQYCPMKNYKEKVLGGIKDFEEKQEKKIKNKKNKIINNKLELTGKSKLKPLPNKGKREILYIAGPQNSGKSYYASEYLKEFQKLFPKKKIYMFSGIDEDANFKGIKRMKRMDMDDEELLDDPIDVKKELSNSLIIFDDIDRSNNPEITDYLHELRNDILKNGRDQSNKGKDIYCISTNHQVTDNHKTRDLLNECTSITVFPQSGSRYGIDRVLQHYIGLSKSQVNKIMKLGEQSRWITIYKHFPQYICWEKGCMLLNQL